MTLTRPIKHVMNHTNKKNNAIVTVAWIAAVVLLPACSTVSVDKQTSAETIAASAATLSLAMSSSSDTSSALLSAGLNKQACMHNFYLCLTRMTDSILIQHYRPALATFAELHYAKSSRACQFYRLPRKSCPATD